MTRSPASTAQWAKANPACQNHGSKPMADKIAYPINNKIPGTKSGKVASLRSKTMGLCVMLVWRAPGLFPVTTGHYSTTTFNNRLTRKVGEGIKPP